MAGNKSVRVYTTEFKNLKKPEEDSKTVYKETIDINEEGKLIRTLERKVWGSTTFETVHGTYVSQERYIELRDKIKSKTLTLDDYKIMRKNLFSYEDVGGRFIIWSKLDNGNLRFKKSADVVEIEPSFRGGGSSSYSEDNK